MESSEPHIVFDVAKDGLHLCRTPGTQFLSELAGQVFTGLLTVFEQAMADADSAVPLSLGALALEWTIGTIKAFIIAPVRDRILSRVTPSDWAFYFKAIVIWCEARPCAFQ